MERNVPISTVWATVDMRTYIYTVPVFVTDQTTTQIVNVH